MSELVTFISNAGGSIVSKNILSHKGKLRWCVREEAINDVKKGKTQKVSLASFRNQLYS